jgi:hypothetical protein
MIRFSDVGYELVKESNGDLYVEIYRALRRTPFVGMKQPTPFGGMLGFETHLIVKKYGLPLICDFELCLDGNLIQSDSTDQLGQCIINVPMPNGIPRIYDLILFDQNIVDILNP